MAPIWWSTFNLKLKYPDLQVHKHKKKTFGERQSCFSCQFHWDHLHWIYFFYIKALTICLYDFEWTCMHICVISMVLLIIQCFMWYCTFHINFRTFNYFSYLKIKSQHLSRGMVCSGLDEPASFCPEWESSYDVTFWKMLNFAIPVTKKAKTDTVKSLI